MDPDIILYRISLKQFKRNRLGIMEEAFHLLDTAGRGHIGPDDFCRLSNEFMGERMTEAQAKVLASFFSSNEKIGFEQFCRIMSGNQ